MFEFIRLYILDSFENGFKIRRIWILEWKVKLDKSWTLT